MDNTVSSEYQRREKENIILEKKEMNLELLDYNFQVEVINSSIKKFLDNFPKSLPSKYSNIVVFPKKERRGLLSHTAFVFCGLLDNARAASVQKNLCADVQPQAWLNAISSWHLSSRPTHDQ